MAQGRDYQTGNSREEVQWISCSLCRIHEAGLQLLERARRRNTRWTQPGNHKKPTVQEFYVHTTLDEAVDAIRSSMTVATKNCKRYFNTIPEKSKSARDHCHCNHFHVDRSAQVCQDTAKNVKVFVKPGTYVVSAATWGADKQESHMIKMAPGQMFSMDLNLH